MKPISNKTFYVFDYLGAEMFHGTRDEIAKFLNVSMHSIYKASSPSAIRSGHNVIKSLSITDTAEYERHLSHTHGFNFLSGDLSLEVHDTEGCLCDRLDIRTVKEFKDINEALTLNEIEED